MEALKLSAVVESLIVEILELKERLDSALVVAVMAAADIGDRLSIARLEIMKGQNNVQYKGRWSKFIRDDVKLSPMWVGGYRALAAARKENPEWFAKIAELGLTKAIRACKASVPFRWSISTKLTVDNQDAVGMTTDEFDAAISMLDPGAGVTLEEPLEEAAKKRRMPKVDRVEAITAQVVKLYDATPEDVGWITHAEWVRATFPEELPAGELATRLGAALPVLRATTSQDVAQLQELYRALGDAIKRLRATAA